MPGRRASPRRSTSRRSSRRLRPPSDVPVLRLSSSDDVLAAVPYLLGFHPERSLVVLGLAGPKGRLGVTMRMDLDGMSPGEMARRGGSALQGGGGEPAGPPGCDTPPHPPPPPPRGPPRPRPPP